jgi:hypothetical protein
MIKNYLLVGVLALFFSHGYASEGAHQTPLRLSGSDFHRYPARMLFTLDGKLVVAYRTAKSKDESSALQVVVFDGRTGDQLAEHSYDVPFARRAKISDDFVLSRDGHSFYYAELTGNPIILEISASTLQVVSSSTARLFGASDVLPRVEFATEKSIYLSSSSRLPGKAVHIVALSRSDVSKTVLDEQISARPDWGQSYRLSFGADSLWMGGGKYWLKTGIKSGQVEAKLTAQNDLLDLKVISSGMIGMTNYYSAGSLQLFDSTGRQTKAQEQPGCGFDSVQVSLDERYGAAVCAKTGTTEWNFGKTIERSAVVFDAQTMIPLKSISLSKQSLQTSIAKDDWRVWYPQPAIWNSGQVILIAVPDFAGAINIQELHP